ncbi:MAG: orotidine-5'-phosphate decarboxylase [Bryobacteraceae bacterium]
MKSNPVIVALDFESAEAARQVVESLGDAISIYKVGLELYAAAGMGFARELIERGKQVFLDLKLYDIGETVKRATARVAESGVHFLTVHGNKAIMRAAAEGRGSSGLKLLAVTVLTCLDQDDLVELGYPCTVTDLVGLRVRNAVEVGMDGIVCSPLEVAAVRALAPRAILITPGVRSAGAGKGDQKRVATPAEAIRAGADYIVVGRQITRAPDPRQEALKILGEIEGARSHC